ncbi:MAG: hypothetical protein MZW92_17665 [Comamonadaceae bacterium]|nr:hypothetical protein [Comamonadaceae bacterium]
MKPAPCSFTPGELMPALARSGTAAATSAPIVKSAWIRPLLRRSLTATASSTSLWRSSLDREQLARRLRPLRRRVMAMRTSAPSALSTHGMVGNDEGQA